MIFSFDVLILLLVVLCALVALSAKDLLAATMVLSAYSFLMCLLWAEMQAVDVSFTEAAVGAGVSGVFMIATLFQTTRKTSD